MTEKEFLEDLKKSYQARLKEISDILANMKDTVTKQALSNNHKNALEDLSKINERLKNL